MESTDTLFEMLDDSTYGFFSKVWGNAIKHASDREFDCLEKYNKADADALKKWLPDKAAEAAANEEIYYEELGASVTKHVLVKMLINLGNADNAQRLCETVPVGFEQSKLWIIPDESQALNRKEANAQRKEAAEMTRKNLVDFFSRVLTPEDVEYAQRKIDAAEMFWGEKNELEKRVKGFGLKKVEATPVLLDIGGKQIVMKVEEFPELAELQGESLIVTDGTTLLGADDKAGVAEIMAMAEFLIKYPEVGHGKIRIGFTPDEEIGCGPDHFDVKLFGADFAYTVDGGALGERKKHPSRQRKGEDDQFHPDRPGVPKFVARLRKSRVYGRV